ncbi:MAG: GntR family transcriptional regulator [Oscillospiraceae bacterium]|nr:GntR family transcriptional regulator [Oscillospiraceae bacterium]
MFDIRLSGKAPIYEQLYNGIAQLISSGRLRPDEKLPAVREVAKNLGINPNTVQKAYSQLETAGLIYSMPAKGSYVSPQREAAEIFRTEAMKRLEECLSDAKNVGVTLEDAVEAAKRIWSDGKGGEI